MQSISPVPAQAVPIRITASQLKSLGLSGALRAATASARIKTPTKHRVRGRTPKCELRPVWAMRRTADTVTLDLPMPPGVNALTRNVPGVGRAKTSGYLSWRKTAVEFGALQAPARIVGRADVTILLSATRLDSDAPIKPLIDAAKEIGVIADDSPRYVRNIELIRSDEPGLVRLVFTKIGAGAEPEGRAV